MGILWIMVPIVLMFVVVALGSLRLAVKSDLRRVYNAYIERADRVKEYMDELVRLVAPCKNSLPKEMAWVFTRIQLEWDDFKEDTFMDERKLMLFTADAVRVAESVKRQNREMSDKVYDYSQLLQTHVLDMFTIGTERPKRYLDLKKGRKGEE